MHEIQRLTNQLELERRDAATQKQETFRKLALLEAEKERALLSRSEANKLLGKLIFVEVKLPHNFFKMFYF